MAAKVDLGSPGKFLSDRWGWLADSRLLVPFVLYLVVLFVWRENVFGQMALAASPDMISATALRRIVAGWLEQGVYPFWNPYFYGGMAMFETFQSSWLFYPLTWLVEGPFPDPANPGFYNGGLAWLLFFGSPVDFLLFHHLLGAVGIAFLVRHLGGRGWAQLVAGLLFLLSPQLVVLSDVGHGSKLYDIALLPWLLLALDRALDRFSPGRIALLAVAFSMMMAAQHVQIAYYGYIAAGLWWLVRQVRNVSVKRAASIGRETVTLLAGGLVGLASTAVIYFNTLAYAGETIRGAEGVGWDYATSWSYHPLESISMFVPDFFGFGGHTYWGWMPFTDMALYWGVAAAVFALIAVISVRSWRVTALVLIGLVAWVASFGKFAPILYRPFYELLPLFNKFRVPSLIHSLVLVSVLVLAGIGLQRVFDVAGGDEQRRRAWKKPLAIALLICLALFVFAVLLQGPVANAISGWVERLHTEHAAQALDFGKRAAVSLVRSLFFTSLILGVLVAVIHRRVPLAFAGAALAAIVLFDLVPFTGRLLHPTSTRMVNRVFYETEMIRYLNGAPRGRLVPLDRSRPLNSWAAFGIELHGGYTGSKPSYYSLVEQRRQLFNPNLLAALNVRYIYSSQELQGLEPVFRGPDEFVYVNPNALPRAYLRGTWEVVDDSRQALERLLERGFNPHSDLILDRDPKNLENGGEVVGSAEITLYTPNEVRLRVISESPAVLVLADAFSASGWTATVDGSPVEILRANGIVRAVAVPGGGSDVVFRYRPALWTISVAVTVASWLVILAAALLPLLRRSAYRRSVE